jgi:hypothetical protein
VDATEQHVYDHLATRGYPNLVSEPDGNCPPDLLVDGRIGVEVRRLNQRDADGERGLEETRIPLFMRIRRLVSGAPSSSAGRKLLGLELRRPLPAWHELEPSLRLYLDEIDRGIRCQGSVMVNGNVQLTYFGTSSDTRSSFSLATVHDADEGGAVLAELLDNLERCVREKSAKTASFRSRYPAWWLALADNIGWHLHNSEREQLREAFILPHDWDKIILINPSDCTDYIDL